MAGKPSHKVLASLSWQVQGKRKLLEQVLEADLNFLTVWRLDGLYRPLSELEQCLEMSLGPNLLCALRGLNGPRESVRLPGAEIPRASSPQYHAMAAPPHSRGPYTTAQCPGTTSRTAIGTPGNRRSDESRPLDPPV